MNVRLYDGPVSTSPALLERVLRKIHRSLKHVAGRIGDVHVWITDLNGRKGGMDKRCRIVAEVVRHGRLAVESRDGDYYRAVDAAAAKIGRAAEHRLSRAR